MKLNTPQNIPTHLQIWNIFVGQMSIIGPRPALWNQHDLIEEREKYKVKDLKPGLTGWAQINGRDELPITVKGKLDGEYANKVNFWIYSKCFLLTFVSDLKTEGVIEGNSTKKEEILDCETLED